MFFPCRQRSRCDDGARKNWGLCDHVANADGSHMPRRPGVPVRQRRVSTELRRLRKEAGLTCADAAKALGVSITKISRMETGERGLYADEVAALLGLYRVPAKLRVELLDLVRNGHDPNWWQTGHGQLPAAWKDLIQLEADATAIANFEPMLVPGLLQTAEYTSALFHGMDSGRSAAEVNALVATRMARQAIFDWPRCDRSPRNHR